MHILSVGLLGLSVLQVNFGRAHMGQQLSNLCPETQRSKVHTTPENTTSAINGCKYCTCACPSQVVLFSTSSCSECRQKLPCHSTGLSRTAVPPQNIAAGKIKPRKESQSYNSTSWSVLYSYTTYTHTHLHALQDGAALFLQRFARVFDGLVGSSADVSHPDGHAGHSSQTTLVMLLELHTHTHTQCFNSL